MNASTHLLWRMDLRKLFVLLYAVLPVMFYLVPWLASVEQGGLLFHFFKTFFVDSATLLTLVVGYVLLGIGFLIALKPTGYVLTMTTRRSGVSDVIACGLFFLYFKVDGGIGGALILPVIIVLISRRWPHHLAFLSMGLIATSELLLHEDRYPVMLVLMLWALPWVAGFSYKRLVLAAGGSLVLLIYVLQPLRSGLMPFSGGSKLSELGYFAAHLQPIYIGAYLSNALEFSERVLWAEAVPTLKSLLGSASVVDRVADVALPFELIQTGTRLGSNSSMYFSSTGWPVLVYCLALIGALAFLFRSRLFRNSLLILLVIQGPYFVRRSFGSLVIDIIVLALVVAVMTVLIHVLKHARPPCATVGPRDVPIGEQ